MFEILSVVEFVKCGNYIVFLCYIVFKVEKKKIVMELLNICVFRWIIEEVRLWIDWIYIGYNMI